MLFLSSPLEQFSILPLNNISLLGFDFSITNSVVISAFGLLCFFFVLCSLSSANESFCVVPNRIQYIIELIYSTVYSLINDNVGPAGKSFFPYVFTLFTFILIANIIGLVPYSFTITSHLIVTFALALMTFIGINLVCFREHGINFLSLFLPPGSSTLLALMLVPIELVSYIFRPISLSVRLFANMMAGHTLLKVIAGFSWAMIVAGSSLALFAHTIPLSILIVLMLLELGVAMIQAYVFTILTCIYINDAIHLH
jgi:F-type H+-transporting ATPase subunit a